MSKALLFIRVSTKDQEQGYSLEAQRRLGQEYAARHDISIQKEVAIAETASKQLRRKEFKKMIAEVATNPELSMILVEKVDRLTRTLHDYAPIMALVEQGKSIHFYKDGFVLNKQSNRSVRLNWELQAVLAGDYSRNLSNEAKKGIDIMRRKGLFPFHAPLGYKCSDIKGLKILDPAKAPKVRQMFESYATGRFTLALLARDIRQNMEDPVVRKRLYVSAVGRMLNNPFYYGAIMTQDGLIIGKHEPLISKELFDQCQTVLREHFKPKTLSRRKDEFQFSGVFKCKECGCSMVGEKKKEKYIYYHCTDKRHLHKGRGEPVQWVPETILEPLMLSALKSLQLPEEQLTAVQKALKDSLKNKESVRKETLADINKQEQHLQDRMRKVYEDMLDFPDGFQRKLRQDILNDYENRLKDIQFRRSSLNNAEVRYYESGIRILDLAQRAAELYQKMSPDKRRRLWGYFLGSNSAMSREVAAEGNIRLDLKWKPPFQTWAGRGVYQFWLPERDETRNIKCRISAKIVNKEHGKRVFEDPKVELE